jgi:hypothetical protein
MKRLFQIEGTVCTKSKKYKKKKNKPYNMMVKVKIKR